MHVPSICMISGFGFFHASGHPNSMLLEYLKGYASHGWKVIALGGQPSSALPLDDELRGRIHFIPLRRPVWVPRSYGVGDGVVSSKRHRTSAAQPELTARFLEENSPGLWRLLPMLKFTAKVLYTLRKLERSGVRVDVLYGIEPHGAFAASICGRVSGRATVSRYMGSWVHWGLNNLGVRFALYYPDIYLGSKVAADLVSATNDGTKADLGLRMVGHRIERIRHWINGVPEVGSLVSIAKYDEPVFVTVSRLVPWKRVDLVMRGFRLALDRVPMARLKIIGDGPLEADLSRFSRELGVCGNVIFMGRIAHLDALYEIRRSWAVVSAYYLSNLTNQVLEALALGTAVITVNDGSTDGLLIPGENCLLASETSLESDLAEAMVAVASDPTLSVRLGNGARVTAARKLMPWRLRMAMEVREVERLLGREKV